MNFVRGLGIFALGSCVTVAGKLKLTNTMFGKDPKMKERQYYEIEGNDFCNYNAIQRYYLKKGIPAFQQRMYRNDTTNQKILRIYQTKLRIRDLWYLGVVYARKDVKEVAFYYEAIRKSDGYSYSPYPPINEE